jgi:hypothetical protein
MTALKIFTFPTVDDDRFYKIHPSKKKRGRFKSKIDAQVRLYSALSDITDSTGMPHEAGCEQSVRGINYRLRMHQNRDQYRRRALDRIGAWENSSRLDEGLYLSAADPIVQC